MTMIKTVPPTRHLRRSALDRRQALVLANAEGTIVSVDCGSVWICRDSAD